QAHGPSVDADLVLGPDMADCARRRLDYEARIGGRLEARVDVEGAAVDHDAVRGRETHAGIVVEPGRSDAGQGQGRAAIGAGLDRFAGLQRAARRCHLPAVPPAATYPDVVEGDRHRRDRFGRTLWLCRQEPGTDRGDGDAGGERKARPAAAAALPLRDDLAPLAAQVLPNRALDLGGRVLARPGRLENPCDVFVTHGRSSCAEARGDVRGLRAENLLKRLAEGDARPRQQRLRCDRADAEPLPDLLDRAALHVFPLERVAVVRWQAVENDAHQTANFGAPVLPDEVVFLGRLVRLDRGAQFRAVIDQHQVLDMPPP